MWYLVIIAIVIIVVLVLRTRTPGASAKGGQDLGTIKDSSHGQTLSATVVRKDICTTTQRESRPTFYYTSTQNKPQNAKIYGVLHFELENHKKKSFYVSKKDFRNVMEGYTGKLTFVGNHFVKFEPENAEAITAELK